MIPYCYRGSQVNVLFQICKCVRKYLNVLVLVGARVCIFLSLIESIRKMFYLFWSSFALVLFLIALHWFMLVFASPYFNLIIVFVLAFPAVSDGVCVLVLDFCYCSFFQFDCRTCFSAPKGSCLPSKLDRLRIGMGGSEDGRFIFPTPAVPCYNIGHIYSPRAGHGHDYCYRGS